MSPEALWLSGFVQGWLYGIPVSFVLFVATRPAVDAIRSLANRGRR